VAAYDLGNARITLFMEDGTTRTIRRPDGRPGYNEDALLFRRDGSLWVAITPIVFPEGGVTHPRPVFARVSDTGAMVDTIFTPALLGDLCPMLSTRQNRRGFWDDRREPYFAKMRPAIPATRRNRMSSYEETPSGRWPWILWTFNMLSGIRWMGFHRPMPREERRSIHLRVGVRGLLPLGDLTTEFDA
jgi:hypothetical protein